MMKTIEEITLVKNGIHRADEPRHFMRIKESTKRVTASLNNTLLASSNASLKLQEVEFDFYDSVYYFPREDVKMAVIVGADEYTHCPLKGDAEALNIKLDDELFEKAAWSYTRPFDHADAIKDYIVFDASRIQIVEHV
jgi:uncharacterized protein (DUF427 family)